MAIKERHCVPCDGTSCALTAAVSLPWFRQLLVLQVVTVTGKGQSIQGLSLHYFSQLHLNLQFIFLKKPIPTSPCTYVLLPSSTSQGNPLNEMTILAVLTSIPPAFNLYIPRFYPHCRNALV